MDFIQCLVILVIKTVSPHFTPHIDLQKLGEIILKGEKYNILKPTVHKITDQFEDEKLRRDTGGNEKVFMDDYGFRHIWKGLENRKSYSKTNNGVENYKRDEDKVNNINENVENGLLRSKKATKRPKPAAKRARTKPTTNKAKNPVAANTDKKLHKAKKSAITNKAKKLAKNNKAKKPAINNKDKKPAASNTAKKPAVAREVKKSNKGKKPAANNKVKPTAEPGHAAREKMQLKLRTEANKTAKGGQERTIAKTYLFCPFLGVIAMSGFID